MLTRWDKVLIAVLLGLSAVGFAALGLLAGEATSVVVEQDGEVVGRYPLSGDFVFAAHGPLGTTHVAIREGAAWIVDSPCAQQTCVRVGRIRRVGDVAVCVPNRVLARIEGKRDGEAPDAVLR